MRPWLSPSTLRIGTLGTVTLYYFTRATCRRPRETWHSHHRKWAIPDTDTVVPSEGSTVWDWNRVLKRGRDIQRKKMKEWVFYWYQTMVLYILLVLSGGSPNSKNRRSTGKKQTLRYYADAIRKMGTIFFQLK